MYKSALSFAAAGLALALAAPNLPPMLERARLAEQREAPPAPTRVAATPAPTSAALGFGDLEIEADAEGQYWVDGFVEGERVRFLVDTGASMVTISSGVASRLGLGETSDSPHYVFQTANGQVSSYGVELTNVEIGSISLDHVAAAVNPNLGDTNLIGANLLRRLSSVEQRDGRLILRP
ncbi:MAG: TIGR02281 family clan AA aspartic protease [Roseiarcus sp.]